MTARTEMGKFAQQLGTRSGVVMVEVLGTLGDNLTFPTFPLAQRTSFLYSAPCGFPLPAQDPNLGVSRLAPNSALSIPKLGLPPRL
jgi:hypothetical protein